jgi:hypothetical protein
MPLYTVKHTKTGRTKTLMMSYADFEGHLKAHPQWEQVFSPVATVDSWRIGVKGTTKASDNHKSRMKEIAKAHPRGFVDAPG